MKQTIFVAVLLTLLMILLIVVAAGAFLFTENRQLETETANLAGTQVAIEATVTQQALELGSRSNALLEEAATRQAMSGDLTLGRQLLEQLQGQLSDNQTSLAELQDSLSFQLLILSPTNGAEVILDEAVEVVVVAIAEDGIDSLAVDVDGQLLASRLTEGLAAMAIQEPWTPDSEGVHTISVMAQRTDGLISDPVSVSVTAISLTPEALTEAMRRQVMADIGALRFPGATETVTLAPGESQSSSDLHQRLLLGSDAYTTEKAADEALALSRLGLLPAGFDLHAFTTGLLEEDVVGYQGQDGTITFYSFTPAEETGAFDRWYYAHPADHELLNKQLNQAGIANLGAEALAALRALAEGEATLMQDLYLQSDGFTGEERASVTAALQASASDALDGAPEYLKNQFEFAYTAGALFVRALYDEGGLEALDAAWNNPPRSTEHILHPDSYSAGDAPKPVLILSPGEGWTLVNEETLGEFMLREYLGQQLTEAQFDAAALGWGGGHFAVYQNEADQSLVTVMRLEWDEPDEDYPQFATAFIAYQDSLLGTDPTQESGGGLCWVNEGIICLYPIDKGTLIVRAADQETVETIVAAQQGG
jgi:hypothetical protein